MNLEPTASPIAVHPAVAGAIRKAAQLTGANFEYLLATAKVESNLNPQSAAPTSTAKGLFQFISQTWLSTLKEQGPALGYGRFADAIERLPSGQFVVTDPKLHDQIMNLRLDPNASALMAGAFTKANTSKLGAWLGRAPNEGELYVAHFLGPAGAAKLIELAEARPQTPAAQVFAGPASANPSIFFDRQGRPRNVAEVYRMLVGRYGVARGDPPAPPAVAKVALVTLPPVLPPAAPPAAIPKVGVAAPVPLTQTYPVMPPPAPPASSPQRVFHGLFRDSENPAPVAPVVSALWGTTPAQPAPQPPAVAAPAPNPPPSPVPTTPPAARPGGSFDLFQEQVPNAGALFRGSI